MPCFSSLLLAPAPPLPRNTIRHRGLISGNNAAVWNHAPRRLVHRSGRKCAGFGSYDFCTGGILYSSKRIVMSMSSGISPSDESNANRVVRGNKVGESTVGTSFLAKLTIALGIAATATVMSYLIKSTSPGSSFTFPVIVDTLSQTAQSTTPVGYNFTLFGHQVFLPEYTPGWIYFWLLMAAGCGLFISEEALNVWIGISLSRKLIIDGSWSSFAQSFSSNASHIISTILWVYWGVCISDMIPFYLGRLFRQSKASEDICSKLGIRKDRAISITRAVQKYGNLIGFVERFSIGVRNPTAFLAGAWGISADCFFAGVCCGGVLTLLIQLGVGFLLREHPVAALAGVATFVGIWTIFPYLLAASTALFLFLRQRHAGIS